jgi:membrane protein implicated in regulation of membrane protease activity
VAAGAASRSNTGASRRFLIVSAWAIWLLIFAVAVVLFWRGYSRVDTAWGISRIMWSVSLALLLPYVPLRALAGWRCRRAARKLPDEWQSGASELPGWPGVRDRNGELKMRCGGGVFRLWALAAGVGVSGYMITRIPDPKAFDIVLSLAPALCALLFSALWGRSGWELSVESARSQVLLVLWRALRRNYYSMVSLPMVQGVALAGERDGGYRGVIIRRAKGNDWKLGVPSNWPPELVESLAARIANLAEVEFDAPDPDEPKTAAPAPASPPAPPEESPSEDPAAPAENQEEEKGNPETSTEPGEE